MEREDPSKKARSDYEYTVTSRDVDMEEESVDYVIVENSSKENGELTIINSGEYRGQQQGHYSGFMQGESNKMQINSNSISYNNGNGNNDNLYDSLPPPLPPRPVAVIAANSPNVKSTEDEKFEKYYQQLPLPKPICRECKESCTICKCLCKECNYRPKSCNCGACGIPLCNIDGVNKLPHIVELGILCNRCFKEKMVDCGMDIQRAIQEKKSLSSISSTNNELTPTDLLEMFLYRKSTRELCDNGLHFLLQLYEPSFSSEKILSEIKFDINDLVNIILYIFLITKQKNSLFFKGAFLIDDRDFRFYSLLKRIGYARKMEKLQSTISLFGVDAWAWTFGSSHLVDYLQLYKSNPCILPDLLTARDTYNMQFRTNTKNTISSTTTTTTTTTNGANNNDITTTTTTTTNTATNTSTTTTTSASMGTAAGSLLANSGSELADSSAMLHSENRYSSVSDVEDFYHYGIDLPIEQRLDLGPLGSYAHILFGRVPPKKPGHQFLFFKLESYGTQNASAMISHGFAYIQSVWRRTSKQLDAKARRERIEHDLLDPFNVIVQHPIFKDLLARGVLTTVGKVYGTKKKDGNIVDPSTVVMELASVMGLSYISEVVKDCNEKLTLECTAPSESTAPSTPTSSGPSRPETPQHFYSGEMRSVSTPTTISTNTAISSPPKYSESYMIECSKLKSLCTGYLEMLNNEKLDHLDIRFGREVVINQAELLSPSANSSRPTS